MKKGFFNNTILALMLIMAGIGTAMAQNYHEIKAKGLFPVSNYARVGETSEMLQNNIIGSGAAIGAGLGYRFNIEITSDIIIFAGGDVLWNNTCTEYRDICVQNRNETAPLYFNAPIWMGVALRTPIGQSDWSAYFDACAGVNIHYTTSTGWKNFEVRYNPAFSAALSLEVGMTFRNYSLGFELMSLGQPTMKGTGEETYHWFKTLDRKRDMIMLNAVFTYRLKKHKKEWKISRKAVLEM